MIIGDGDIATVLNTINRGDLIFFASGVSNSQETRESEYEKEKDLLLSQDSDGHIVYFSSLAVLFADSLYLRHKRRMEQLVKDTFKTYTIVRLGNITWGTNPNTIINFLTEKIKNGKPFEIQDVYRHLVDKDEFLFWMKAIPEWSCEMNITGRMVKVSQIVKEINESIRFTSQFK